MAFRDLILHNFRRKLFSLLLAILVWTTIYYSGQRNRQRVDLTSPTNSAATYP